MVSPSESVYDPEWHLSLDDVRVDSLDAPSRLEVTLKASKTDPFRQGHVLHVGATNQPVCPVAAVLSYMVVRGKNPGPLFTWGNQKFLTRAGFVEGLRRALASAGLKPGNYADHSFRIGAASTAARCGIQDSLIKTLGRWESSAYTRYIRTSPDTICKVSKSLLNGTWS